VAPPPLLYVQLLLIIDLRRRRSDERSFDANKINTVKKALNILYYIYLLKLNVIFKIISLSFLYQNLIRAWENKNFKKEEELGEADRFIRQVLLKRERGSALTQ
jgi:hypothetical protein